jgi:hypothetical protein
MEDAMKQWGPGVVVALVALLATPLLVVADETPADQPSFRVEKVNLELGKIKAGEVAEATFVFHNDGDQAVKIIRAKPS